MRSVIFSCYGNLESKVKFPKVLLKLFKLFPRLLFPLCERFWFVVLQGLFDRVWLDASNNIRKMLWFIEAIYTYGNFKWQFSFPKFHSVFRFFRIFPDFPGFFRIYPDFLNLKMPKFQIKIYSAHEVGL